MWAKRQIGKESVVAREKVADVQLNGTDGSDKVAVGENDTLGTPVDPEVYMMQATSSRVGDEAQLRWP